MAMGTLYQTMAHSLGILMQNTVTCQQNMNTIAQAATAQGVAMIYSVDTAATGLATSKILQDK
jgi:phospholipase C